MLAVVHNQSSPDEGETLHSHRMVHSRLTSGFVMRATHQEQAAGSRTAQHSSGCSSSIRGHVWGGGQHSSYLPGGYCVASTSTQASTAFERQGPCLPEPWARQAVIRLPCSMRTRNMRGLCYIELMSTPAVRHLVNGPAEGKVV